MKKNWKKWRQRKNERTEKSTRRNLSPERKIRLKRRNRQQKKVQKNTGKEIKKENKDTEKGTWKSVTKERVYDPNGKVLVITYACVVLFLALAVYMGYFLQMKSEDVINNPYNARLDSFSDRIVGSILASGGTVLAETTTDDAGNETRVLQLWRCVLTMR